MHLVICRQIRQGPVAGVGIALGNETSNNKTSKDKTIKMIKVTKLATSGPAAAQGVKPGDLLIQVNELDVTYKDEFFLIGGTQYKDVKEVQEMMKGSPGSTIKLKLKRDGTEYEVLLERSRGTGTSKMASIRGMQGKVPGTVRYFDKVHDWVQVACVSVSVSVSVMESAVPGSGTMLQINTAFHQLIHSNVTGIPELTHVETRVRARAVIAALHGYIYGCARPLIIDIIQCVCVCSRVCVCA
jgi:hypothetical protein